MGVSDMDRIYFAALLASTALLAMPAAQAQAQVAQSRTFRFDAPAQDLSEALIAFSRVTGLPLAAAPAALRNLRSQPVQGQMTAQQALARMTRSLPVEARIQANRVIVQPRPKVTAISGANRPAAPTPARAATAALPPQDAVPDEIVVTGFRRSLDVAQAKKRAATGVQEVIVAEDIAAFPDQNLAEALQRVAGVAITRDSGEGRRISLRGLGPEFTRTQLNGMEVLSNTASGLDSRGGVSRSRAFDYSVFASELFNEVVVEKSWSAAQEEGGIGGTVGLRTGKPFDYAKDTLVLSAKGQVNQYTDKLTPRLVGLASAHRGDFGVLVSAAYSSADTIEWGYRNWNWSQMNWGEDNVAPSIIGPIRDQLVNATGSERVWNSRAQTYGSWFNHRERLGLTGTLQYNPGNGTDVTLDVLYSRLTNDRAENIIGNAGDNGLDANDVTGTQQLQSVTIDSHGSITDAVVSGVDLRSEAKPTQDSTDFWQVALNGRTDLTDRLELNGTAGWSKSTFDSAWQRAYLVSNGHTIGFAGLDTDTPVNSYDFDPADPSAWTLQSLQWRENHIESEFWNSQAALGWQATDSSTLRLGGEFKQFENSAYQYQGTNNNPGALANLPTLVNPYSAAIPFVVGNVPAIYAALGQDIALDESNLSTGTDYTVKERTFAAFAQYELNTTLGGMDLRADLGVRYYNTRLTSRGSSVTDAGLVPVEIRNSYDGFLPALNIALNLRPDLIARIGANRNISRPGFADLSAAATVRVAGYGGTISAGNPYLAPYTADSIEAALEYYDGTRGFLALGLFYKNMKSFVTTETTQVPYGETGYPLSLLEDGLDASTVFNFTRPINGPGASIHGVELAARRNFDFLPGPLRNLGAQGNVTYADGSSDVLYSGVAYDLPLTDLSKWSVNGTIYYDTPQFGARGSVAYRSRYRSGSGGNGNIGEYFTPSTVFDATAYYNVTPMLQLRVEGLNLSDQRIVQYADGEAKRLMTSTVSGRTITFGATLRF